MPVHLSEQELEALLDMPSVIEAVERGFGEYVRGAVDMPLRSRVDTPKGLLLTMPCGMRESRILGAKLVTVFPANAERGLPRIAATYVLLGYDTGLALATMDGAFITGIRTAAASAVATKHLARPDAQTLGIFGTSVQAKFHALAIPCVRSIKTVRVLGRSLEKAQAFAQELRPRLDAEIIATSQPEEVAMCDVVVTATNSSVPVLFGKDLQPGAHVNAVGAHSPTNRELDTIAIAKSVLFADSREAALAESGEVVLAIQEGAITPDHIRAELGEVVTNKKPGRQSKDEITVFKSNGLAFQDAVTAQLAYQRHKS